MPSMLSASLPVFGGGIWRWDLAAASVAVAVAEGKRVRVCVRACVRAWDGARKGVCPIGAAYMPHAYLAPAVLSSRLHREGMPWT